MQLCCNHLTVNVNQSFRSVFKLAFKTADCKNKQSFCSIFVRKCIAWLFVQAFHKSFEEVQFYWNENKYKYKNWWPFKGCHVSNGFWLCTDFCVALRTVSGQEFDVRNNSLVVFCKTRHVILLPDCKDLFHFFLCIRCRGDDEKTIEQINGNTMRALVASASNPENIKTNIKWGLDKVGNMTSEKWPQWPVVRMSRSMGTP